MKENREIRKCVSVCQSCWAFCLFISGLLYFQSSPKNTVRLHRCWWLYLGDNFWMLMTEFRSSFGCWCPTLMLKDRVCWWQKLPKPLPTSQICRQHMSSPTSITNSDVALQFTWSNYWSQLVLHVPFNLASSNRTCKSPTPRVPNSDTKLGLLKWGNRCSGTSSFGTEVTSISTCGLRHLMLTSASCKMITCAEVNLCRS